MCRWYADELKRPSSPSPPSPLQQQQPQPPPYPINLSPTFDNVIALLEAVLATTTPTSVHVQQLTALVSGLADGAGDGLATGDALADSASAVDATAPSSSS
ncbi:unnamed protein product [Rotaria sordida]|uniref:Uncharacterized protein n=1 Tax=Rotaria sordida TaxID=392033 RepID=A0A813URN4_9BILA|nr:unnamed protein product [Rotaria sordida]CAF0829777.1 unnamed protein product [Rotaria sordida]CAF0882964.1 unnamed protein product [Rotaria sordida]CAF3603124.1 unnamed protein product [Rotaria sordida]CAF3637691.1 unnamed protein product [Rotaria sordida]